MMVSVFFAKIIMHTKLSSVIKFVGSHRVLLSSYLLLVPKKNNNMKATHFPRRKMNNLRVERKNERKKEAKKTHTAISNPIHSTEIGRHLYLVFMFLYGLHFGQFAYKCDLLFIVLAVFSAPSSRNGRETNQVTTVKERSDDKQKRITEMQKFTRPEPFNR